MHSASRVLSILTYPSIILPDSLVFKQNHKRIGLFRIIFFYHISKEQASSRRHQHQTSKRTQHICHHER